MEASVLGVHVSIKHTMILSQQAVCARAIKCRVLPLGANWPPPAACALQVSELGRRVVIGCNRPTAVKIFMRLRLQFFYYC